MRLSEFAELEAIPRPVLLDLLFTNTLPLQIDSDGYLCLSIDQESAKALVKQAVEQTATYMKEQEPFIRAQLDKVVREELGGLLEEALAELQSGKLPTEESSDG